MKILLTGASGLLGTAVFNELVAHSDWEVLGTCHSNRSDKRLIQVDLTKLDSVTELLNSYKPNIIVHCAYERRPDIVEKETEQASKLNINATSHLALLATRLSSADGQCWLLFISSDYVFDGTNAPYAEDARPNPLNTYGRQKLNGEQAVLGASSEFAVLRVPLLYGDVVDLQQSPVTTLFGNLLASSQQGRVCDYDAFRPRRPTHVRDCARVIAQMCAARANRSRPVSGIYHWSALETFTKYDMVVLMARLFSIPLDCARPIYSEPPTADTANRPLDVSLSCQRLESWIDMTQLRRPFAECIETVLKPHVTRS